MTFRRICECELPLTVGSSKNARWRSSFRTRSVYKTKEAKDNDDLWRDIILDNLDHSVIPIIDLASPRVHLDIIVFQPWQKLDPCNVIDSVCDVVKNVLPVDDKFFSLNLDWEKGERKISLWIDVKIRELDRLKVKK